MAVLLTEPIVHPLRNGALFTAERAMGTIADSGNGDTLLALISHST